MIKANYIPYRLHFKKPAGTSRGVLYYKDSWFLTVQDQKEKFTAIGECSLLPGLSPDNQYDYEKVLSDVCQKINDLQSIKSDFVSIEYPSIRFGLEILELDYKTKGSKQLFKNGFTLKKAPITINGLIWMAPIEDMLQQAEQKIKAGFKCVKLKIGALDFESELSLIRQLRSKYPADLQELRLDANGAFKTADEALKKIEQLSQFQIHSVEQPVKQGQPELMAKVCSNSPVPIALDEELIGIYSKKDQEYLIKKIRPQYIILKPSLLGGIKASQSWIDLAESNKIPWWTTSALESNIGLNAIAQWTYSLNVSLPQGLGTGQLYGNNFPSPLTVSNGGIFYDLKKKWDCGEILNFEC